MFAQCCQLLVIFPFYPLGLMRGMFQNVEAASSKDWQLALNKQDRDDLEAPHRKRPRADPFTIRSKAPGGRRHIPTDASHPLTPCSRDPRIAALKRMKGEDWSVH